MMQELNKNILVTGATSGIGKGIVEELVKNPTNTVYGIGRDASKIVELQKYPNFNFIAFDLYQVEEIEKLFKNQFSDIKFSGFIHCAGIEETLPVTLYTPQRVQNIFQLNVFSAIEILRFLSKKKHAVDQASFILLSSVMGELAKPGIIGYCASKAAILGLVKSLALELSKRKIRVNAVSPGIVNTPLTQRLFEQLDADSIAKLKDMYPLGIGEVADVVGMFMFLLSDQSKWITGQNFKIDGGYSIQ
ncbi:SDR family NAD(P)-dependent oxidoreductase [Sphingobacterium sp. UDSM-2020]|uniref:SDR family NAD(P)-dependent oxidoreductase n=1 Tax=Sphingobacterium sp. UDSM-2020 TaxID=2795738 RepID=UPI001935E64C|nr:SDR family oxidoreductase [Sphingobacterium sp. UDSM-2020]QQD15391.1 SDR family oxidoreductase [Sphingobacterium sp. UDSM-2020]